MDYKIRKTSKFGGLTTGMSYSITWRTAGGTYEHATGRFEYAHVEDDNTLTYVFDDGARFGLSEGSIMSVRALGLDSPAGAGASVEPERG